MTHILLMSMKKTRPEKQVRIIEARIIEVRLMKARMIEVRLILARKIGINRGPDKRGVDNRGPTVRIFGVLIFHSSDRISHFASVEETSQSDFESRRGTSWGAR